MCGFLNLYSSDKELKNLVDQIHDCGYLDNMPEFPEVEEEPAPVPTAAEEEPAGLLHILCVFSLFLLVVFTIGCLEIIKELCKQLM